MTISLAESRVAIVIHAFYARQLQQIAEYLERLFEANNTLGINIAIDVYITLTADSDTEVHAVINNQLKQAKVYQYSNYGMDLLPFFRLLPQLQHYDWVLKLHTKNDKTQQDKVWFDALLQGLVGSPEVFFNTLKLLQQKPSWNMAGLMPFFVSAQHLMFNNQANVTKLVSLCLLDSDQQLHTNEDWGFFAGSFYWLRPRSFLLFANQLVEKESWFKEAFSKDGQMAHAVERLMTKVAKQTGDVGLLLPPTVPQSMPSTLYTATILALDDKHPAAINHIFMQHLLEAYTTLTDDLNILQSVPLLDVHDYAKQIGIDFNSDLQAYHHYLLIGQFNGYANKAYPFELKQAERRLIDWNKQQHKLRDASLISIIIPVFNHLQLTLACLQAVKKHTKSSNYEIIVVDNGSRTFVSKSLMLYAKLNAKVKVLHLQQNLNFAIACNYGFSQSKGETIVFLNNDTEVTVDWLPVLQHMIAKPNIVAVQPKLIYFDNTVQCAGVNFDKDGFGVSRYEGADKDDAQVAISGACAALTAACLMLKAKDFASLKGFDAWYINGQEDMDLCVRLQAMHLNKTLWYEAGSEVYHHTSKSQGRRDNINQNRAIFRAKWHFSSVN